MYHLQLSRCRDQTSGIFQGISAKCLKQPLLKRAYECNKKVCNSNLLSHVPLLICHVYCIAHCFLLNQLVRVQVHSRSGQVQFCTDALCDERLNSNKPKSSGQNSAQGNERKAKKPDNQQHSLICEIQLHLLVCFICCLLSIVLSISALFVDADQSSRLFTK